MTPATRSGIRTAAAARRQPRQPAAVRHRPAIRCRQRPACTMRKGAHPMREAPSVTDLVTQARNGDKQAWDALVDRGNSPRSSGQSAKDTTWAAPTPATSARSSGCSSWTACDRPRPGRACGLAGHHHPAGMRPGPARRAPAAGSRAGAGRANIPDEQTAKAEQELLMAERPAALREAFTHAPTLPAADRHAHRRSSGAVRQDQRQTRHPVENIAPHRSRCLAKLRHDPAIAA